MSKKRNLMKCVRRELGLPRGATAAEVLAALDILRESARDADLAVARLQADAHKKERADAVAREIMKNPDGRRGYLKAQERSKNGGLTNEQLRLAAQIGIVDPARLAAISSAMVRAEVIRPPMPIPGENGNPDLTPEQLRFLRRCGVEEPDPDEIARIGDLMRSGLGYEIPVQKPSKAAA